MKTGERVLCALAEYPMPSWEIAEELGIGRKAVRMALLRLRKSGKVMSVGKEPGKRRSFNLWERCDATCD